jgi:hypothetical protein
MSSQNEKHAERLYNKILTTEIYPLTGNKSTYLTDLDRVGRKLLNIKFKGVFPSDKIPKLNDLKPYCILNLDKSTEGGSHWIAVAKIPGENSSITYDSFSRPANKIIPALKHSGNGAIINSDLSDAEQTITETDCGARSMAWLVLLDRKGVGTARLI